ncbi:MAG: hypothetical protein ACFFD1_13820 [Candidatus Thorarchaeota archaeon]
MGIISKVFLIFILLNLNPVNQSITHPLNFEAPSKNVSVLLPPIINQNDSLIYQDQTIIIQTLVVYGNLTLNNSKIFFLPLNGFENHFVINIQPNAFVNIIKCNFDFSSDVFQSDYSFELHNQSSLLIEKSVINNPGYNSLGFIHGSPQNLLIYNSTFSNTKTPINISVSHLINSKVIITQSSFLSSKGLIDFHIDGYNTLSITDSLFTNEDKNLFSRIVLTNNQNLKILNSTFGFINQNIELKNTSYLTLMGNNFFSNEPTDISFLNLLNIFNLLIEKNRYSNFQYPIQFNGNKNSGIVHLNDFYGLPPDLMYKLLPINNSVNFNNNFYESESFIDLNADGLSDINFYLDQEPLMFPFESYSIENNKLTITNPYLIIISENHPFKPFFDFNVLLFCSYMAGIIAILVIYLFRSRVTLKNKKN